MDDHYCVYCAKATPSTTEKGKMFCNSLSKVVNKTDGKYCPYFK